MFATGIAKQNCTAGVVGCIAFIIAQTAFAPAAQAQGCPDCPLPPVVIPEEPYCSFIPDPDDPYDLCPKGTKPCSADDCTPLCCYHCIQADLPCATIFCPDPPPPPPWECPDGSFEHTCPPDCPGGGCWLYTAKTSHCPADEPLQVGSLMTYRACNIDCSPPEDLQWSICAGSGEIVQTSGQCATIRATGPGLLVVNAFTSATCFHFQIESQVIIQDSCAADIDDNGTVDTDDLVAVITNWGSPGCGGTLPCPADLDCNGNVDTDDMSQVINQWGCP